MVVSKITLWIRLTSLEAITSELFYGNMMINE